jgi:hypothetical protein
MKGRNMHKTLSVLLCVVIFSLLTACESGGNSGDSRTSRTDASGPVAVATGLPDMDASNIYVGHRYRLIEAMTDRDWAESLLGSRAAGNASGIRTAYAQDSYESFSRDNAPTCIVEDQHPVNVTDWNIGGMGLEEPIACKMDDGTIVYATDLGAYPQRK